MAAAAHEMWSRAAWAVLALGATIDVPATTLLAGLPFDEAALRQRKRITWEEYCGIASAPRLRRVGAPAPSLVSASAQTWMASPAS